MQNKDKMQFFTYIKALERKTSLLFNFHLIYFNIYSTDHANPIV